MQRSSLYLLWLGEARISALVTPPRGCGCQRHAAPGIPITDEHSPPPHKGGVPSVPSDQSDARLLRTDRNEAAGMAPDFPAVVVHHQHASGPREVVAGMLRLVVDDLVHLVGREAAASGAYALHLVACFHGAFPPGLVIQSVTHGIRLMHQRLLCGE